MGAASTLAFVCLMGCLVAISGQNAGLHQRQLVADFNDPNLLVACSTPDDLGAAPKSQQCGLVLIYS